MYCADAVEDTHAALVAVKRKFPKNPIYAIGFSMGANIITNVSYALI